MRKLTRRELLKVSLGTMGAMALANLPNWNKPALRMGVLPAHAQSSQLPRYDLQYTLVWNKGNTAPGGDLLTEADVDIALFEPAPTGEFVYYDNPDGISAHLDMDNTWGFGPENIYVPEGGALAGFYLLGFVLKLGILPNGEKYIGPLAYPVTATFTVKTYVGTAQEQSRTFTYTITALTLPIGAGIAIVEFPSGNITAFSGTKETWKGK